MNDADRLLTTREVCQLLRISLKTLQLLRRNRKISFVRFGHRSIRFREEAVLNFVARREKAAEAAERVA